MFKQKLCDNLDFIALGMSIVNLIVLFVGDTLINSSMLAMMAKCDTRISLFTAVWMLYVVGILLTILFIKAVFIKDFMRHIDCKIACATIATDRKNEVKTILMLFSIVWPAFIVMNLFVAIGVGIQLLVKKPIELWCYVSNKIFKF